MKYIFEVFDEFEMADSEKERMQIIGENLSTALCEVLKLTFHPGFQWWITEFPEDYIFPDTEARNFVETQLSTELRKMYLFQKGNETSDRLTPDKRMQLLCQLLEGLHPREAEVVAGILRKDQGIEGLDYSFVKRAFSNLLP